MFPNLDNFPKMEKFIRYKTSSPSGDLLSFLAGIKEIHSQTGERAIIYQRLNMIGVGVPGASHAYQNDQGDDICFSQYAFDMMRPLLLAQEYIEDFVVYNGQEYDTDMDQLRNQIFTNQPRGCLNRYPALVFPQMATDLSKPWLAVEGKGRQEEKVVINITERYRNHFVSYFFLKEYPGQLVFAGLPKERDLFCKEWDLDIPLLQVDNFHELAKEIASCKFFLGNASMCFQIAEALKVPRILEIFQLIPNVIPVGEHAYDFYHQGAVEFYFHKLFNKQS